MKIVHGSEDGDPRRRELVRALVEYNDQVGPPENWEWLALYAEDENGALLGGIHGAFEWDYLMIKNLWVGQQKKGLGSKLLKRAEEIASKKGKKGVWLDTFDFQARGFYEKQGYNLFGQINNAAGSHARYFLVKHF